MILDKRPAPVDESQQRRVEADTLRLAERRQKVSVASGQLITAALSLAGELVGGDQAEAPPEEMVGRLTDRLGECVERDSEGRPQLTISLPDDQALRGLATTLARLLH